jgi:hypothetical protein
MDNPTRLPTQQDFDPYGEDLDAQWAWKNFGGLTVDQAKAKFTQRPEIYYEDFMSMGGKAFAYYYPVIDSFVREVPLLPLKDRNEHEVWIVAQCIENQCRGCNDPYIRHLNRDVLDLCRFVRENMLLFGTDPYVLNKIDQQWTALEQHLNATNE